MVARFQDVQPVMARCLRNLDEDTSLAALSRFAGQSRFQLHRQFHAAAGETPKRFALRLRLERAAAMLLATRDSVLSIALACGFSNHESFSRAFRRYFQMSPKEYRQRGIQGDPERHSDWVVEIGPCIGLYGMSEQASAKGCRMSYVVEKTVLEPQPVLRVRKRVPRGEISSTIGGLLPGIFVFAQQHGIALSGHPLTRYIDAGVGMVTMEPSMRISGAGDKPIVVDPAWLTNDTGDTVVQDTLPGGSAAFTVHFGPYEQLPEAYAAIEQWIAAHGLKPAGAPWESYVTDPTESPDSKDWKTEVFWPLED